MADIDKNADVSISHIWKPGGLVAYSTDKWSEGRRFEVNDAQARAWQGEPAGSFVERMHITGRVHDVGPFIEAYVPLFSRDGERVVAVAESYIDADFLKDELATARTAIWLGLGSLAAVATAFSVRPTASSADSEVARPEASAEETSLRAVIEAEVGNLRADLHDGPAQAIALACLVLDEPVEAHAPEASAEKRRFVLSVLRGALAEIRALSAGEGLPGLEAAPVGAVVERVTRNHERMTGMRVSREVDEAVADLPLDPDASLCLYRFVQEGLSNAYKHAATSAVRVICRRDGDALRAEVVDDGRGLAPDAFERGRLGLVGLRSRVGRMGGEVGLEEKPEGGCRLWLRFVHHEEHDHA